MPAPLIGIIGLGASTPIGRTVWASAAAARAGICGFSQHPFMVDTIGGPMRIASAKWLAAGIEGAARYAALLFPAIDEVLAQIDGDRSLHAMRIGLALALPAPRPGLPEGLARTLSDEIAARFAGRFTAVACFEAGHAAGVIALDAAIRRMSNEATSFDAFVVAGVDSYLEPETLEWLEACDQLHGAGPLNNAWGFIPGEAAGALAIARDMADPLGDVVSIGLGREAHLIKSEDVCTGDGLTRAFHSALDSLVAGTRVDNVFCDLNGETYRADEYAFSALRMGARMRSASDFVAPADCWGDVGAAGALLHIALGVIAARKGYGRGALSLVWASSEGGERGAVVVRG